MFTAAIMMCLIDVERSVKTCDVMYGNFKYRTESLCWKSINEKVLTLSEYPMIRESYEVASAKCTSWLPLSENGI